MQLARAISYLFHPIFMPIIGVLILFFSGDVIGFNLYTDDASHQRSIIILSIFLVCTCILPIVTIFLLKKSNLISSIELPDKDERSLPYLSTLTYYFLALWLIVYYFKITPPILVSQFYIGAVASIAFTMFISFFYKISAHMAGIGGIVGLFMTLRYLFDDSYYLFLLVISILLSGLIGFARLRMDVHKPHQVYLGFILGFVCETLIVWVNLI